MLAHLYFAVCIGVVGISGLNKPLGAQFDCLVSRAAAMSVRSCALLSPPANVRNLVHTACPYDQMRRGAQGRFDPFAAPSANGRYLRTAAI